jgi:hypothetical protein
MKTFLIFIHQLIEKFDQRYLAGGITQRSSSTGAFNKSTESFTGFFTGTTIGPFGLFVAHDLMNFTQAMFWWNVSRFCYVFHALIICQLSPGEQGKKSYVLQKTHHE